MKNFAWILPPVVLIVAYLCFEKKGVVVEKAASENVGLLIFCLVAALIGCLYLIIAYRAEKEISSYKKNLFKERELNDEEKGYLN